MVVHADATHAYNLREVASMTDTITKGGSGPSKATSKKKLVVIVAALLVAVGLAVPAAIFGPQLVGVDDSSNEAGTNPPAGAPAEGANPGAVTEFRNDQAGIALSYPANWVPLKTADPQILLLASDGPENSFLVRSVDLPKPVGKPELPAAKQLTDQIVGGNKTAKMITEPKQVELGGLPGYWYLYSFKDEASGQEGAHSHFFLFKGNKMLTFVFQTVPVDQFQQSAPVFDQITASLRVLDK